MSIIKKASVAANEQDAQEITQPQNTPTPEQKQVENMTIKEIVAECESHYCCGDCGIRTFCKTNFHWLKEPREWKSKEE